MTLTISAMGSSRPSALKLSRAADGGLCAAMALFGRWQVSSWGEWTSPGCRKQNHRLEEHLLFHTMLDHIVWNMVAERV